jgi:hypothetical protein
VVQSDKFELINVKVAKSLGIKISDNLLSLADEVIEYIFLLHCTCLLMCHVQML